VPRVLLQALERLLAPLAWVRPLLRALLLLLETVLPPLYRLNQLGQVLLPPLAALLLPLLALGLPLPLWPVLLLAALLPLLQHVVGELLWGIAWTALSLKDPKEALRLGVYLPKSRWDWAWGGVVAAQLVPAKRLKTALKSLSAVIAAVVQLCDPGIELKGQHMGVGPPAGKLCQQSSHTKHARWHPGTMPLALLALHGELT
jgi:hypothetical protein